MLLSNLRVSNRADELDRLCDGSPHDCMKMYQSCCAYAPLLCSWQCRGIHVVRVGTARKDAITLIALLAWVMHGTQRESWVRKVLFEVIEWQIQGFRYQAPQSAHKSRIDWRCIW